MSIWIMNYDKENQEGVFKKQIKSKEEINRQLCI